MIAERPVASESELKKTLKEVFGYDHFRGLQEPVINSILQGQDTFVIMPTGAGKSLCYQLPGIIQPGTAIVISPLIALMKNQVDALNGVGVKAHFLNSTLSKSEIQRVRREVLSGEVKLLYVAPESLTKKENINFLKKAELSFVAIDEAHCISEWGHDFRPEYRRIKAIIEAIGELPVIALTATATPKVQADILKNLQIEEANVYKSSFNRENLFYEVRPKHQGTKKELIRFVKQFKGESGIIYCLSRKKVEEIADLLNVNDIKAIPYHAGLEGATRVKHQDAFLKETAHVVVATIAFGMGIDKPDVRFVLHYDTPKSLEGYYQETGRAGRDGLEARCLMFYSLKDIEKLEKFNKDKTVTERDNARHLLGEMKAYADSSVCRRRQLLHYFGEYLGEDCGHCDNCKDPNRVTYRSKSDPELLIRAIYQTGERFSIAHVVDVLIGKRNEYTRSYGHQELSFFGKGQHQEPKYWQSMARQLQIFNLLGQEVENFGVLFLTEAGHQFLAEPRTLTFYQDNDYSNRSAFQEVEEEQNGPETSGFDQALYNLLKKTQEEVADQKGVPPYAVFFPASLQEMATVYPTTEEQLSQIHGVGMGKIRKFGTPFLKVIRQYVEDNNIVTANDVVVKTAVNKSKIKIYIIQQIDRKVDLEEIAETKNLSMEELITEIEHICYSGTKLNLDYYLDAVLDDERQDEIYDYFLDSDTDDIGDALEELGEEDFTEEDIRLVRVKFLSEVAN